MKIINNLRLPKFTVIQIVIIIIFEFSFNSCAQNITPINANIVRLETDLTIITKSDDYRNFRNSKALNRVSEYIFAELNKVCDTVYFQTFEVRGTTYRNVIGSINSKATNRIVIGAHYDVEGASEGADDNASGVAGVLELARLLSSQKLNRSIDFVAYCLEEPPYFGTKNMGSYMHAKYLNDNKIAVEGMICLEMIGYFSDEPDSQNYPIKLLKYFYGTKGNYITVVNKYSNGNFAKNFSRKMTAQKLLPTKKFSGSAKITGLDFSDHRNYWEFGYSAVMITNTAFYRNPNYHKETDKLETLDLNRMTLVIEEVYRSIISL
ncbi:MAG TPA: peptidase M28 [Bacteroidales bacterium]|nr:peptidase M28 [Bacteroidales bacterium]